MSYLSKDQLDNYLNDLPNKKSIPNTNNTTSTYQALKNELVYPMKNMNINNKSNQTNKMDAFEASLKPRGVTTTSYKTKPPLLGTKTISTTITNNNNETLQTPSTPKTPPLTTTMNNNNNKQIPPPIPAKKPTQFISKPINTSDKVNIPKPTFQQTLCGNCNKPVSTGIMVTALGKKWHNGCFQCTTCHIPLDKVEFFEKEGQPYCEEDYHQLFNHVCDYCKQVITETSIKALGKQYHVGHFFCHTCKTPFDEDHPFMIQDGLAYCEPDYLKLYGKQCKGCNKFIKGTFVGALGGDWHKECFVCTECQQPFPSGVFHVRDDRPYCERHAIVLPQQKNLKSSNPSPPSLPPKLSNPNSNPPPPPIPTSQRPNITPSSSPISSNHHQQQSSNSNSNNNNNVCHTCKESLDNAKLTSSAFGKNYHSFHFQCCSCHRPLSSRVPGLWQNNGQDEVICKQCVGS
ncbi:unnamed protein product [Cunninghamella blakesleeana]